MMQTRKLAALATAIFVSLPLVYFGLEPLHLAEVSIHPHSEERVQILTKQFTSPVSDAGALFFDFHGALVTPGVDEVSIEIRSDHENTYYQQTTGGRVDYGRFLEAAQLGSPEWPLHADASYSYKISAPEGSVLSTGRIHARVHSVAGGPRFFIIFLGVLASILQLVSLVARSPREHAA